jgi:hypothetical protein
MEAPRASSWVASASIRRPGQAGLVVDGGLKLQRRGVLTFLSDTLHAHRRGLLTPSLLPIADTPLLANAA